MASLIKKIASTVDRLPEGIERAQATIEGKGQPNGCNPPPFFRPWTFAQGVPFVIPRITAGGSRRIYFTPGGSSREFIPVTVVDSQPTGLTRYGHR